MLRFLFPLYVLYSKARQATTAIEYALIAAGIALAIVAVVFAFGDHLFGMYDLLSTAWDDNVST